MSAYPYYFPNYYQPPMQDNLAQLRNQQLPQTPPVHNNSGLIWVQGETGAKSYLVAPNNTVTLWDSESPTIYIKSADINGMPSMRVLDFTERTANVPKIPVEHTCKCGDKFVLKEDFDALQAKFEGLAAKLEDMKPKATSKSKKDEVEE